MPMDKQLVYKNKSVFYNVSGHGNPVVLIHGVPEDGSMWHNQTEFLSNRYQLIIPDLPGSGKSELTDEVSIDAMADVIKYILDAETISKAVIIGHSMGGYVSVAFAEKFPGMIKALGLFHSSAYSDSDDKKEARKKNIAFIQKHGSYEFIRQSTPGLFSDTFKKDNKESVDGIIEKYKNFNPDSLAAYQQAMMDRSDKRKVFERIGEPVLFIIGANDKALPFEDSMQQCHIPALSYIHILKNSGHMGMLEEMEKSNDILEMFLKDVW
jgi:pimeloyl-ACP methyl ester carboxylesterase